QPRELRSGSFRRPEAAGRKPSATSCLSAAGLSLPRAISLRAGRRLVRPSGYERERRLWPTAVELLAQARLCRVARDRSRWRSAAGAMRTTGGPDAGDQRTLDPPALPRLAAGHVSR